MKRLIPILILFAASACEKEDLKKEQPKQVQTVPTQTVQVAPKQYLIVIEREYTTTFFFKINGQEITTLTAIAYSGDKIEIIDSGMDSWSLSPNGDVNQNKNEGRVTIKVYINNQLIRDVNCNCDFEFIKTMD